MECRRVSRKRNLARRQSPPPHGNAYCRRAILNSQFAIKTKLKRCVCLICAAILCSSFSFSSFSEDLPCYFNDEDKHIYACAKVPCKRVALTFDDGPHPTYTDAILRVLDQYGAKATFFVIGENVALHPEVFARTVARGHAIGSHTYTHGHIKAQSEQTLREELQKNRELLRRFGVSTPFFRPPEGVCDEKVLKLAREQDVEIILWAIDTGDWRCPRHETIERAVLKNVRGGEIILMHDYVAGRSATPQALETILQTLSSEGYEFVTVNELLELK